MFLFVCIASIVILELRIRPLATQFASSRARQFASELIDHAVVTLLDVGEPLVEVQQNETGVASAEVNTRAIAKLRTEAVKAITAELESAENLRLTVPLFNLSNSALTSGIGFPITVQLLPIGDITANIKTDFLESGINQVLHRVVLRVHISLELLIAHEITAIDVVSDIPLAETVIVGVVPEAYTAINRYEIDEQEENDLNDYAASIP